ncbi:hypothetical protein Tco_0453612 [Tanacetum coccineum]
MIGVESSNCVGGGFRCLLILLMCLLEGICFSCFVSDSILSLCHRINKPCRRASLCLTASLAGFVLDFSMSWLRSCFGLLPVACLAICSLFVDTSARNDAWLLMLVYFPDFRIVQCILGSFWLLVACLVFEPNGWLQVGMASGMTSVKLCDKACIALSVLRVYCVEYLMNALLGLLYTEHIVGMDLTILVCPLISVLASLKRLVLRVGLSIRGATSKRNATWLILSVVICLSQRLSHACVIKKLVVGLWVGSAGPPYGVHRFTRPFCRRCAPGLNWLGRASGAVTLKKLECSKQAYALRTTAKAFAKDVFINQERKLGARRRSDTVLVSTINDADQGSADVAYRTPLAPYEKSKFLGSGGSMVARLKLKGIDGRAPPGVESAA